MTTHSLQMVTGYDPTGSVALLALFANGHTIQPLRRAGSQDVAAWLTFARVDNAQAVFASRWFERSTAAALIATGLTAEQVEAARADMQLSVCRYYDAAVADFVRGLGLEVAP